MATRKRQPGTEARELDLIKQHSRFEQLFIERHRRDLKMSFHHLFELDTAGDYLIEQVQDEWRGWLAAQCDTPALPDHLREFVEAVASSYTYRDRLEALCCTGCDSDLDDKEPHKPDCIVLRAQALLEPLGALDHGSLPDAAA
jgi:hypothetical protein